MTLQAMTDAADAVGYQLANAAEVFGLLYDGISGGWMKGEDPGVIALCELCSAALRQAADKEGSLVGAMAATLRQSHKEDAT